MTPAVTAGDGATAEAVGARVADKPQPTFRSAFLRALRLWAWATASGMVAGVLVFGIAGRIAMRIIAATSSDAAQGAFTDAGEKIGDISLGGTVGLLIFAGLFFGALGGWLYAVLRPLLPEPRGKRALAGAAIGAAVGTPILISPGERDFSILDPLWLAVALFVALPIIYGVVIGPVAERFRAFYEDAPLRFPHVLAFLPLAPVLLAGPVFLAGLVGCAVAALVAGRPRPAWFRPAATGAVCLAAGWSLAAGVSEIRDVEGRDPRPSDFVEPEFD